MEAFWMLLKIFAAVSAAATALYIVTVGRGMSAICIAGIILLRFVEYFLALTLAYAALAYIVTELTVKLDEPQDKPSKFWQWNFRQMADIVCFYTRMNITVSGREKLPNDKRYLLVCNHRAFFDPIVKAKVFGKENYIYISKTSNFKIPVGGKVMHKCGCMALNRENNREALMTIKRAGEILKNDVASIVIYPEGTRSRKDELLPFHAGSFKIAQRAGAPVVVAAIRGTDDFKHNFPFKSTKVYLDIIDVIDGDFVKEHNTKDTAELAQSMIQAKLDSVRNKENCSSNA